MAWLSPLVALGLTVLFGVVLFAVLGKDPVRGLELFFVEPLKDARALSELSIKAVPLLLIGIGLSLAFRANVWNIGAEGQFLLGAVFATGVALRATPDSGSGFWVLTLLAGAVGGALWAAVAALLRVRFNANEILVSLMLVYVAEQVVSYLVAGPWKDPQGYNFPQTITFVDAARVPRLVTGSRANWGIPLALCCAAAAAVFLHRTHAGYRLTVAGASPNAARYAGFSSRSTLWTAFLLSGALAGLAAGLEVMGPLGQLTQHVSVGYGFAAIIVAFVGRLEPFGVCFASVLLSMFYIGGELAQSRLGLPKAVSGVFQGLLLFSLLACDTLVQQRLRWRVRAPALASRASARVLNVTRDASAPKA
jgi:simple sugar transport system permease protein